MKDNLTFQTRPRKQLKRTPFKKKLKVIKVKKPKEDKKSKRSLHKKLWKLFSKFIRERDNYICFTCGNKTYPAQAGHYRTGATCKKYLFFDERNVHCQCYHCNINLSGNWRVYQQKMWEKYGDTIDETFDKLNQRDGWDYPYEKMIEFYENKLSTVTTCANTTIC